MKILVTGGAGFIGSHVVDTYIDQGHQVVVVDDLSSGRLTNLNPDAAFYQADIRDPQAIRTIFEHERPEIVNHHAAQRDLYRSVDDPLFDANVNVIGSINLIDMARRFGVQRFIYVSSGEALYGRPEYLPCDEAHPIHPVCPYGASKLTVEHYLAMYNQIYGLNYTVLRYPKVYGPRQDRKGEAGVVAELAESMICDEEVAINGNAEDEADFMYVRDCARANLMVLRADRNEVYNLGSGKPTSINEIFSILRTLTGYRRKLIKQSLRPGVPGKFYLDASKINRELGWMPVVNLADGLEVVVRNL